MCDCVEKMRKPLEEHNSALDIPLTVNRSAMQRVSIAVHKLDSKKKKSIPVLFASYCPFCGVEYA